MASIICCRKLNTVIRGAFFSDSIIVAPHLIDVSFLYSFGENKKSEYLT